MPLGGFSTNNLCRYGAAVIAFFAAANVLVPVDLLESLLSVVRSARCYCIQQINEQINGQLIDQEKCTIDKTNQWRLRSLKPKVHFQ